MPVSSPPSPAAPAVTKSAVQLSAASVRQKNTDVPSGAATAVRSASPGPRSRGSTGASRRSARAREPTGSALSTAIAATRGPSAAGGSWLTRIRVSPWRHSCTAFVRCWPAWRKPMAISSRSRLGGLRRRDRQLGERVAAQRGGRREPALEQQQRAHRVDRHPPRIGLAEDVVEDLERERALVAGRQHVLEEAGEVEAALPREAAVVAAPLQHVHDQVRRVRELEEEQLLGRDVADAGGVAAAREDVEGVDAGAERRVVARLHDPPRVVVVAHVAAPRQRLVGDPEPARAGALGQLPQLRGGERVVVDRLRRHVGADEHGVRAQLLHHGELALRAPQVRRQPLLRHRLEVAQRLVERDLEPERLAAPPHLPRPLARRDQVGLEQLDGVEARGGGRRELLLQRPAQADGGDRAAAQNRFPNWLMPTIVEHTPSSTIAAPMITSR